MVAAASLAMVSGSLLLAMPTQAAAPQPAAKTIAGSHPAWATPSADAGAVPSSTETTGTVYLAGQDAAGLTRYATAVSDPNSASYGKYLSPAAYQARFGATKAQIAAVQKWVKDSGLTVLGTTDHAITVKGTNAALTKAFGTGIHQYKVGGKLRHAPARNVVVPAAVSSAVIGVTGLSSAGANVVRPDSVKVSAGTAAKAGAASGRRPADHGDLLRLLGPEAGQGRAAGLHQEGRSPSTSAPSTPRSCARRTASRASGMTGKGATVAIVDAYGSSTMQADAEPVRDQPR